jgi:hypothetical protein
MSRRYGRNQKRRARAEIAQLMADLERSAGIARRFADKSARLDREIERAKSLLPLGSVLISEPATFCDGGEPREHMQVCSHGPLPDLLASDAHAEACSLQQDIPLDMLLTDVLIDKVRDELHFQVEFAGQIWRYGITRAGLRRLGRRELVAMISKKLAQQISVDLDRMGITR